MWWGAGRWDIAAGSRQLSRRRRLSRGVHFESCEIGDIRAEGPLSRNPERPAVLNGHANVRALLAVHATRSAFAGGDVKVTGNYSPHQALSNGQSSSRAARAAMPACERAVPLVALRLRGRGEEVALLALLAPRLALHHEHALGRLAQQRRRSHRSTGDPRACRGAQRGPLPKGSGPEGQLPARSVT